VAFSSCAEKSMEENTEEVTETVDESIWGFPYVDFQFIEYCGSNNEEDEYVIVYFDNYYEHDKRNYYILDDQEMMREIHRWSGNVAIYTFPPCLGTTADGSIRLYKNGSCIKSVQYTGEIMINDDRIRELFRPVSETELKDVYGI